MMINKLKVYFLDSFVSLLVIIIVGVVLIILKQPWSYWLIGGFTGMLTHSLLVKQTNVLIRNAQLDPEGKTLNPKKTVMVWYSLRTLVFLGVFGSLTLNDYFKDDSNLAIHILIAFAGFMTTKVILIILLLIFRRDVKE